MEERDLQAVVQAYLQAFKARDLSRCLDFYAEDATIDFQSGLYRGREDIEEWHKERFAADLRVVRVDEIRVQGNTVILEAVATSNRLKAWRIANLTGTATFVFQQGKIKETKFGLRMSNLLEGWR